MSPNQVFAITFTIIALGYLLKRFDLLNEKDGKVISKFLMHSTFPALLFVSMYRAKLEPALFLLPFIAILSGVLMLVLGWYLLRNYANPQRGVLMLGLGAFNTGLFGFPIFEGLFGSESLNYAIMFDIGVTFMVFAVLYPMSAYFSGSHQKGISRSIIFKKVLSSPPVVVVIFGLSLNVLNITLPSFCLDFADALAKGNKPIVLLLMGIYLNFSLEKKQRISIYKVLAIRYLVGGFFAVLTYCFVPAEQELLRNLLMLCVVLPIGMTILPFSDEMNLDTRLAGVLLNVSLVVSFVLMWGIMNFL